jgi:phosphoribosyl 1,2-cyclic phosphate phosphodiesterase
MQITFLGTGTSQGVPLIGCKCEVCQSTNPKDNRLRSSVYIEYEGTYFVIDTGPDFRQQMLRENIEKLDAVLFTHEHKDHIAGFDDIRAFNYIQKKDIEVYATKYVEIGLKRDFFYVFSGDKYPGIPEINLHIIENKPFNLLNVPIIPIELIHYKLPVLGFRVDDFSYLSDLNYISEQEKKKLIGTKVLVVDGLRHTKHISHFCLEEALELIEEIKPEKAYITHISHQLGMHDKVESILPKNVFLAYDGLKIKM